VYADFPITVKDYAGDKTHWESFADQMARHTLHNSVKELISTGASLDENYFPILWHEDGGSTSALDDYLKPLETV